MRIKTALAPILIAIIIGGLFLVSMVSGQTSGQSDWPTLLGDPSHTGSTTGTLITPNLLWTYPTNGPGGGESSPAVVNGVLYVGSLDGNLYALNATDGMKLWNYSTGGWVDSSPAVDNGIVYFGSTGGGFYALNATNGDKIWTFTTDWIYSSPAVVDGVVYFAGSHTVYALNARSGMMLWSNSISSSYWEIYSSPAVADGVVYIGSGDHNLYALNATDGSKLWAYTTNLWVESSPTVANGIVYVVSDDSNLYALNASNGQKAWSYSGILSRAGHNGAYVPYANGTVYVITASLLANALTALDAKAGKQLWNSSASNCEPFPIVVGNVLYVGGNNDLFAFNATDGSLLWNSNQIGAILSSPAYADGVVYVYSTNGYIYAFGTPSTASTQATPSPASTNAVPEFPTLIILPLFAVATLLWIVFIKEISKK